MGTVTAGAAGATAVAGTRPDDGASGVVTGARRARGPIDPRLLRHARAEWPGIAGLAALGVVSAGTAVAAAVAAALLVAALVAAPGVLPRTEIAVLAVVVVVRALVAWAEPVLAARTAGRVVDGLRDRLLTELVRRPVRGGTTLVGHGLDELRPWFTAYLPALVPAVVAPPAVLVVLVVVDPASALVVALTLPLIPVFAILLGWATRSRVRTQWAAGERLAGHFLDVVSGLATLRLFGRARRQADAVARVGAVHRRATLSVLRVAFLSTTALELVATVSVGLVAVGAGLRLVEGTMLLAPALVAILLAPEAYRPVREVGARFHDTARAGVVLDEVDAVLGGASDDDPREGARRAGPGDVGEGSLRGGAAIRVRDLHVRFPGRRADALALDRLDLSHTELVAVAGPSGGGKTTLLRVLTGLAVPACGEVVVRGTVRSLPQAPVLPHARTVGEAVGAGEDDGDGTRDLLRRLGLDLDLDAPLAEGGRSLSAGQRQRLALVRVLADVRRDPADAVVLLDEPTAHLDPATEHAVVGELRALAARGAAVLAVAHRPALLEAADRVVTVDPASAPAAVPTPTAGPAAASGSTPDTVAAAPTDEPPPDEPPPDEPLPDARHLRLRTVGAVLLGAGSSLAGVALTAAAAWLIVRAVDRPPVLVLSLAVVAVRAFAIARPLLRHLERLVAHDGALARVVGWRRTVVADLADRVPGAVAGRRGHLLARVVDDVDTRLDGELRGRLPLAVAAVTVPVVLLGAALLAPTVALALTVGLVLASLVVPLLAGLLASRVGRAEDTATDALLAAVVETVAGREELAPRGRAALLDVPRRRAADADRVRRRAGCVRGTTAGLGQLALGAATLTAAVAAVGAGVSAEVTAILVLAPLALAEPIGVLPDAARALVRGRQARERLGAVGRTVPPAREPDPAAPAPAGADVVVRGLVAGWGPDPALRGLDLDLPAGRRVAVTGASGSGKSTLAAVLVRLLDPRSGDVTLGGTPVTALDGDTVRRRVGLIGEHDHVFATTLRENLRPAAPTATDAELVAALRRVRLGAWLAGLEDGLDTWLAADEVSGGERRRLAAARALLADPEVLVLDEPTEGLDADTAEELVADLLDAARGRTVLLLAHRREGLDRVDAVLDLAGGVLHRVGPATPVGRGPWAEAGRSGAVGPAAQVKSPAA